MMNLNFNFLILLKNLIKIYKDHSILNAKFSTYPIKVTEILKFYLLEGRTNKFMMK